MQLVNTPLSLLLPCKTFPLTTARLVNMYIGITWKTSGFNLELR